MPTILRTLPGLILWALVTVMSPALAQEGGAPTLDFTGPGFVSPKADFGSPGTLDGAMLPYTSGDLPASLTAPENTLTLEARLVEGSEPLRSGVSWRVFSTEPGADGHLQVIAEEDGGRASVQLAPGSYFINAAFGRASATKRVTIDRDDHFESVVLNAGGLRLGAVVGEDSPIDPAKVSFEISQETEEGLNTMIVPKASANQILRLSAGTYHVISRYGAANAVVRADIEVEPGKLTEAVIRHAGAEVTLKLVSEPGGEAVANTSWTVLTNGGDTVHESVGAFPSLILAEGKYTAVASHEGKAYSSDFPIEAGVDRDVEVQLTDVVVPEP